MTRTFCISRDLRVRGHFGDRLQIICKHSQNLRQNIFLDSIYIVEGCLLPLSPLPQAIVCAFGRWCSLTTEKKPNQATTFLQRAKPRGTPGLIGIPAEWRAINTSLGKIGDIRPATRAGSRYSPPATVQNALTTVAGNRVRGCVSKSQAISEHQGNGDLTRQQNKKTQQNEKGDFCTFFALDGQKSQGNMISSRPFSKHLTDEKIIRISTKTP